MRNATLTEFQGVKLKARSQFPVEKHSIPATLVKETEFQG